MSSRRLLGLVLALAAAPLLVPASASSAGGCTITGTPGDDLLRGTNGDDVICGMGGNDDLRGRGGDDVLRGGSGDDSLYASGGRDLLIGGPGADYCNPGPESTSCDVDTTLPVVDHITAEVDTVDVTDGSARVVVRVGVSDETPVDASQTPTIYFSSSGEDGAGGLEPATLRLETGTRTHGEWSAIAKVPRGFPASTVSGWVYVRDTGLNLTREWSGPLFEITDERPDLDPPRVHLRAPSTNERVGLRGTDTLRIRARLVDVGTGVAGRPSLCLRALAGPTTYCGPSRLVSGDRYDGTWVGRVDLGRRHETGRYCVEAYVSDRIRSVGVTCEAALGEESSMVAFARGQSGEFRLVSR